jgi:type II secretory pathway pseudopilin PulG
MSQRDRIVVIVVAIVAVVAAGWMIVVSPEREKASKLAAQVSSAQSALNTAQGKLGEARNAQAQYAKAYSAIVSLGKAVPAADEVPSLIYELERASNSKSVDFNSIVNGGTSSSGSSSSSSAHSGAAAAASAAGFTAMPFTFTFNGSYFNLEHLFESLDHFTVRTSSGPLEVSGRLLTIDSVKLTPLGTSAETGHKASAVLTGTITATAYILPASEGLTAGATPSGPAGATSASASGSTSTVTPAVVTP